MDTSLGPDALFNLKLMVVEFEAHRLWYHSTLSSRLIQKMEMVVT